MQPAGAWHPTQVTSATMHVWPQCPPPSCSTCVSPPCCRQAHSEGLLRRCVLQTLEGLELTLHSACTGVALLTLHTWLEDLR